MMHTKLFCEYASEGNSQHLTNMKRTYSMNYFVCMRMRRFPPCAILNKRETLIRCTDDASNRLSVSNCPFVCTKRMRLFSICCVRSVRRVIRSIFLFSVCVLLFNTNSANIAEHILAHAHARPPVQRSSKTNVLISNISCSSAYFLLAA